jgi:hypothetical protein
MAAVTLASFAASARRAPPTSVQASTTPAQMIPMQISVARPIASVSTSPWAPPVAPSSYMATIKAVKPANPAA